MWSPDLLWERLSYFQLITQFLCQGPSINDVCSLRQMGLAQKLFGFSTAVLFQIRTKERGDQGEPRSSFMDGSLRNINLTTGRLREFRLSPRTGPCDTRGRREKELSSSWVMRWITGGLRNTWSSDRYLLGVAAGYRERLFAKISDHYVDRRTQNFLRAISPCNLPRRPVHDTKARCRWSCDRGVDNLLKLGCKLMHQ